MSPAKKIARIRAIFAEFMSTGSPQMLIDSLTRDAVYTMSIGPGTPISGPFVGKESIAGYFRDLPATADHLAVNIHDYLANDDKVVVLGDETLRIKENGVVFFSEFATVFTFRGKKICHVLAVENLGAISNAYDAPPASPPAQGHGPTSTPTPLAA
ncbi:nuclear transport factor 2 family protein [Chondromyces apiculatus]|uniref:SnoaL-like domain-containing protein n=1 Tax=Chondromyces apiculatus DSM 436 TaxID=1192034 RepID=A0A017STL6_9BACT|nr:nuclear transport factor 2 family protein [Chondromyces apiculatus]EYF00092.1 Hypothetical protein CAP_1376 [Chondromyces apiculatus DSM 436]